MSVALTGGRGGEGGQREAGEAWRPALRRPKELFASGSVTLPNTSGYPFRTMWFRATWAATPAGTEE
eukprot:3384668-Heterocapsa_arctica.AAC.1